MKLSMRTLSILRNFASIEQSMLFRTGNVVSTKTEKIFARANIEETIPEEFAISELSRFISVISMFNEPDIDITSQRITISEGSESVSYPCADTRFVNHPPADGVKGVNIDVEFDISATQLAKLSKTLSVIGAGNVIIQGDGTDITIEATTIQRGSNDTNGMSYKTTLGRTDRVFKMTFLSETFRMLQGDYRIGVSKRKVVRFKADDLEYWVVAEAKNSTFE